MARTYQPLPMTIWDIKARMRNRGYSQVRVAHEQGVSESHISHVLKGDRPSRRIEKALAQAAGLTHEQFLRLRKKAA